MVRVYCTFRLGTSCYHIEESNLQRNRKEMVVAIDYSQSDDFVDASRGIKDNYKSSTYGTLGTNGIRK